MPEREREILEEKLATLSAWVTAGICFFLVLVVSIIGVLLWQSVRVTNTAQSLREVATETHESLCALKLDLSVRYTSGREFLRDNPDGIPGISATQIQQSLANQKSTLDALAPLDCR
jgi:hypothetical protein